MTQRDHCVLASAHMSWRNSSKQALKALVRPVARHIFPARVDLPLDTWSLSRSADHTLLLRGQPLHALLARYGSPLFVVDAQKLDDNVAAFLERPADTAGGVECFYSYKTNPVPGVLRRLHTRGAGAEVISAYELWLAQKLGVRGENIVFNGPGRSPEALKTALEAGALVCVNHREEIALLTGYAHALGKRARVGLRVVPSAGWGGQFGESLSDGSAHRALGQLLAQPELELVALHMHLGGEIASPDVVLGMADELLDFAAYARREHQHAFDILDFGGSLACPTVSRHTGGAIQRNRKFAADLCPRDPSTVLSIRDYVRTLVRRVEQRCQREAWPRPRIFVEPGRALTSDTQLLLCSVTGLKQSGAAGVPHAILDAGVNIAEPVRNEYHQIFKLAGVAAAETPYRLVGPICTPMDTLVAAWRLPELAIGDALAVMDAGAYFVPFSTSFSFPQPGIVMLDQGEVTVLRRAESFDDLVRRDLGLQTT